MSVGACDWKADNIMVKKEDIKRHHRWHAMHKKEC